ncbi:MAG: hypothetical protein IT425_03000 [Pirellulales bacterium]|nr:hypothetical protein [Pirellulales bacterium]
MKCHFQLAAATRPPVFTGNPSHLYRPPTTYQQNQSHHNAADNTTNTPPPLNPASSLLLKFDPWNRQVELKNVSTVVTANEYDGLGRRIRRDVVPNGNSAAYDDYYNEQWQLLEERKNADTDPLSQYVWHPEGQKGSGLFFGLSWAGCHWLCQCDCDAEGLLLNGRTQFPIPCGR